MKGADRCSIRLDVSAAGQRRLTEECSFVNPEGRASPSRNKGTFTSPAFPSASVSNLMPASPSERTKPGAYASLNEPIPSSALPTIIESYPA